MIPGGMRVALVAGTMTAQTYTTLWHAMLSTQGRKRAEGAAVLADFLESIGEVNLSARLRGVATYPHGYLPYTPWPLEN
jgi:hypothetical protein